jgi:hypothetical protein
MIDIDINADEFLKGLGKCLDGVEKCVGTEVKGIVNYIDKKVHERTPVHSGQAVRNMIWSQGTGGGGGEALEAIHEPEATGYTSQMGLGEEPRRKANQDAAQATLHALNFENPFTVYTLANHSPDIGMIEDGSSGIAGKSRAPNGVFAITVAEVMEKVKAGSPLS